MEMFLLLVIVAFILILNYLVSGYDLLSPSVLYIGGFFIAIFAASLNIDTWGIELHFKTVVVLLLGLIGFICGEGFARKTVRHGYKNLKKNYYRINPLFMIIIICIDIVLTYMLYKEIIRLSAFAHDYYKNIGVMTAFKSALGEGYQLNEMVEQLLKISTSMAYICTFVIINNTVIEKRIRLKDNLLYFLVIFIFIIQSFLKGGRGGLILYVFYITFIVYFYAKSNRNWSRLVSDKFLKRVGLIFILLIVGFYYSKTLVGRSSTESIFDYTTRYFGGSIALLDLYMEKPMSATNNIIGETFPGLCQSLIKLGFSMEPTSINLEFRYANTGVMLGNIYTQLRRAFNDFGYIGVFFMPFILSVFFHRWYQKLKLIKSFSTKDLCSFILYATLVGSLSMQAMEDQLFTSKISIGYIIQVIILFVCIRITLKSKPVELEE